MKENGYEMKRYGYPVKRYCQTMDLKDDPELIEKYRECHSKEKSWRAGMGRFCIGIPTMQERGTC